MVEENLNKKYFVNKHGNYMEIIAFERYDLNFNFCLKKQIMHKFKIQLDLEFFFSFLLAFLALIT